MKSTMEWLSQRPKIQDHLNNYLMKDYFNWAMDIFKNAMILMQLFYIVILFVLFLV